MMKRLMGLLEQAKKEPTPKLFQEIHFELDLLEYHARIRHGWKPSVPPLFKAHCGCGWCEATTLVNFAWPGSPPEWYCVDHEPPFDKSMGSPVGYSAPLGPLLAKANEMSDRWTKFRDKLKERTST